MWNLYLRRRPGWINFRYSIQLHRRDWYPISPVNNSALGGFEFYAGFRRLAVWVYQKYYTSLCILCWEKKYYILNCTRLYCTISLFKSTQYDKNTHEIFMGLQLLLWYNKYLKSCFIHILLVISHAIIVYPLHSVSRYDSMMSHPSAFHSSFVFNLLIPGGCWRGQGIISIFWQSSDWNSL